MDFTGFPGLAGKTAIVTGSTQGLGADIARGFAAAGANVVLVGRGAEAGQALARTLGAQALYCETDIGHDSQIQGCIDAALARFGRLDILVNNACQYSDRGLASTREEWHRTLDTNLVSAAIFTQLAAPHLPRGGVVVNMGSTGGKFGAAGRALYPASKAALLQITKNFAVELAPGGVRVLAVSPAWTWSPSVEQLAGSREAADTVGAHFHPLGRVGSGEEIAAAVCFACSDAASWMTGVDIPVDGGFSILGPDRGISPRAWFKELAP
ncbi:4-formylbenzenesulfonate dehydrogenase TsaC1/TsaC2 [compost metagenome]|uniref:glucose 1-dehydrogenase n=1 Tax=Achromobacter sp. Root83 TaxID=1736602 RepID=UPI000708E933|nr:glucose 1-dehydrogenase [Achromobacter sp. Root83]KRC84909.1 short-chain dehydrogenase [Achromobacter sp. Root83]